MEPNTNHPSWLLISLGPVPSHPSLLDQRNRKQHSMHPGSLFEFLGGELVDIAEYATRCHERVGRPPRFAVNASSWWYAGMTTYTEDGIRNRYRAEHPTYNPKYTLNPMDLNLSAKNIFFYTVRMLQLGIQLHFVFDGPKGLSNGGKLHPGHDPPPRLLRDMLTQIGVPWHEAPATAEAECAKMEMEDLADAVWSEDGDALAFGCRTLIRFHSTPKKQKSYTEFKIFRLNDVVAQHSGMNRDGFILHAILTGTSSDVRGFYDLEPQDLVEAAAFGVGRSLCTPVGPKENRKQWAHQANTHLLEYKILYGKDWEISPTYPTFEHVQDYLSPKTSDKNWLSNLPQPQNPSINEQEAYTFLVEKFQWTLKQWVKFIIPVRIVRSLLATQEGQESQHDHLGLKKKRQLPSTSRLKFKVAFLRDQATSIDVSELTGKKEDDIIETLHWILRKANIDEQSPLATPRSNQRGKATAVAGTSTSAPEAQQFGILTPPTTGLQPNSNGEGSSTQRDLPRQVTPESPTPAPKKRKLPWENAPVTKNISRSPPIKTTVPKKGKGKEVATPNATGKRSRSPTDSSSSDAFEEMSDKRQKTAVRPVQPPSLLPSLMHAPEPIVIADEEPDIEIVDDPSTPSAQIRKEAEIIVLDSDSSDESGDYGSFPSLTDLPPTPILIENSPVDQYGSFPASPDLRALV